MGRNITPADEGERAARKDTMSKISRLHRTKELLEEIEDRVSEICRIEPYGDLHENFRDSDGTLVTTRLIKMIEADL